MTRIPDRELIEHVEFVRRLAVSLVGQGAADDVSQDVLLRAMESRGRSVRTIRAWLVQVTRNVVKQAHRGESRRRRREHAAARAESVVLDEQIAERATLLRRIAEIVERLPDADRAVVWLRYYEGLAPREIAERQGLGASTVRSRLTRALAKIRAELDRSPGGRSRWMGALIPLVLPTRGQGATVSTGAVIGGALLMKWKAGAALAAIAVILGSGIYWVLRDSDAPEEPKIESHSDMGALEHLEPSRPVAQVTEAAGAEQRIEEEASVQADTEKRTVDGRARVTAQFRLPGGAPAPGTLLELKFSSRSVVRDAGEIEANETGEAVLPFEPPPDTDRLLLRASLDGFAVYQWRRSAVGEGQIVDLGVVELQPGCVIEGQVVDRDGRAIEDQFWISARSAVTAPGLGGEPASVNVASKLDGSFRLEGLPPGMIRLEATSNRLESHEPAFDNVRANAGITTGVDLCFDRIDTSRRIRVWTSVETFTGFDPAEGTIHLIDEYGKRRSCGGIAPVFESLSPGTYTVEIDDPRLTHFTQGNVRPGGEVRAKLKGSSGLRLHVTDEDGATLEWFGLEIHYRSADIWPKSFLVLSEEDEPRPGGLIDGVVPGELTLVISASGRAKARLDLDLPSGATLDVPVTLSRGATLEGVVRAAGSQAPISGALVILSPTDLVQDLRKGGVQPGPVKERSWQTTTDDQGRYRLENIPEGEYDLAGWIHDLIAVQRSELAIQGDINVDLTMPESAAVVGRLLGPEQASFEGMKLRASLQPGFYPVDPHWPSRVVTWDFENRLEVPVSQAGEFRLEPLPVGIELRIELALPGTRVPSGIGSGTSVAGAALRLESVRLEAGETRQVEYDLMDRFPGFLEIEVTSAGGPAAGFAVEASRLDSGEDVPEAGGQLDANGRLRLGPVLPGVWTLSVHAQGQDWYSGSSPPVRLEPGGEAKIALDVTPSKAIVTFVDDATGQPIADSFVLVGSKVQMTTRRTDAEGRLEITCVPGPIYFRPGTNPGAPPVELDWTPTGPATDVVRLPVQ